MVAKLFFSWFVQYMPNFFVNFMVFIIRTFLYWQDWLTLWTWEVRWLLQWSGFDFLSRILCLFLGETLTLKCLSPAKIVNGFRWTVMITKIANRQVNLCSWVPVFEKGFTFHLTVSVIMLTRTSHPVSISCSDFADQILRWHRVQLYPIPGRSTGNLIYYSLIFYKVRIL